METKKFKETLKKLYQIVSQASGLIPKVFYFKQGYVYVNNGSTLAVGQTETRFEGSVDANLLMSYLNYEDIEEIEILDSATSMKIKTSRGNYTIALQIVEIPVFPKKGKQYELQLPRISYSKLLKCAAQKTSSSLDRIYMEYNENGDVHLCATNKFILAEIGDRLEDSKYILLPEDIKYIEEQSIDKVFISEEWMHIQISNIIYAFNIKAVDMKFPNYKALPISRENAFNVDSKALKTSLQSIKPFLNKVSIVNLAIKENTLIITAGNEDYNSQSQFSIPIIPVDIAPSVEVNINFFNAMNLLNLIEGNITICLNDSIRPIIIKENKNQYLLTKQM